MAIWPAKKPGALYAAAMANRPPSELPEMTRSVFPARKRLSISGATSFVMKLRKASALPEFPSPSVAVIV
jgi:hypothetical protein